MKLVTTRVGDCCNAHIFLTHFSIIRQLIIGSHSDYHLLGNNPSAALYGRHLPLHKGGFGAYLPSLLPADAGLRRGPESRATSLCTREAFVRAVRQSIPLSSPARAQSFRGALTAPPVNSVSLIEQTASLSTFTCTFFWTAVDFSDTITG